MPATSPRNPLLSLGAHLPARTVLVQSFSKSFGPDLRLAAVGGPDDLVGELVARRLLGAGWSSRLLQGVLLDLLADPATADTLAAARATYARRRASLADALAERGVGTTGQDGINLWVEVADEQAAAYRLAAHGIGVAVGSPVRRRTPRPRPHPDHLRPGAGRRGRPGRPGGRERAPPSPRARGW